MIFMIISLLLAISTTILSILYIRLRQSKCNTFQKVDREIEKAEKILNNIIIFLRKSK